MSARKSSFPLDNLIYRHHQERLKRSRRQVQFRLSTLLLVITASWVLFAFFNPWELARSRLFAEKIRIMQSLPQAPAGDVLFVPLLLGSMLLGAPICLFVRYLGIKKGYVLFCMLACLGLLSLVGAACLHAAPLRDTELRFLRRDQILRITLFWLACVPTVSALLGWLLATLEDQRR